jgi:alpha-amylase
MATVRNKITYKYLNPLIKIGVAGFRIDAAKHMNPEDITRILRPIKLRPTVGRQRWFEKDTPPYVYLEVIDKGGEPIKATDYFGIGRVRITEFKACDELAKVFRRKTQLQYLRNWGEQWNLLPSDRAFIFVDNHDNQRGHGGGGSVLTHKVKDERIY